MLRSTASLHSVLSSAGATVGSNSPIVGGVVSKETEIVLRVEEVGLVRWAQSGRPDHRRGYPGDVFSGTVASNAPPRARSRTCLRRSRLPKPDPQGRLRDGMFAQVSLQAPARQSLLVPSQAVITRSSRTIVFVVGADSRVQAHAI